MQDEPNVFMLVLSGLAAYGVFRFFKDSSGPTRIAPSPQPPQPARRVLVRRTMPRRVPPAPTPAVHRASREMQLALIQVREAPDFRRAASFVAQAHEVPLAFRQRQYRRFRSLLILHLTSLLNRDVSIDSLMPGLTQVVSGLGIAPFEAEYIRNAAELRLSTATPQAPDFAQQLREAQHEYDEREAGELHGRLDHVRDEPALAARLRG